MAIDRSLRATIGQLIALEKSGADLGGEETQPVAYTDDAPKEASPKPSESEGVPGSVGAGDQAEVLGGPEDPKHGPKAPISVPAPSGGGGSRR